MRWRFLEFRASRGEIHPNNSLKLLAFSVYECAFSLQSIQCTTMNGNGGNTAQCKIVQCAVSFTVNETGTGAFDNCIKVLKR